MAVRPVDAQDFSKASTVVRSDSAVVIVLAMRSLSWERRRFCWTYELRR